MDTLLIQPLFIGTSELLVIGALVLLLFGGKKLPEMMKGLGQGVQNFKKGMNEPLPEEKKKDEENKQKDEVQTPEKALNIDTQER